MKARSSIFEIITVFLLVSLVNCFSDEFETEQLQKAKRKAMRNSLVRFGKRAAARPLFPFYDGFGALRSSRYSSNAFDAPLNTKYEEDDSPNYIAVIRNSVVPKPEIIPAAPRPSPSRYNFLRYWRAKSADGGAKIGEGDETSPI